MSQIRLALPLALAVAIGPFAIDTYLPSFPAMAEFLGVSVHDISMSVPVYVAFLALGQLIAGPVADKWGRQKVMMIGMAIFVAASLAICWVSTLWQLMIFRGAQAFGGGWVLVCVPALVRDRTEGIATAKLFNLIGLIMVAAPAIAPAIGGVLLEWQGWKSIFLFLGGYGVFTALVLKNTLFARQPLLAKHTTSNSSSSFLQRYTVVLKTPSALRFILFQGMIFSIMLLFITHASFIYQQYYGASTGIFSILFGLNVVSMWFVMMLNRFLLNHFSPYNILRIAVLVQFVGVGILMTLSLANAALWAFVPAMMFVVGAGGALTPNSQACFMQKFKENGGTASALMGAMQFGISGLVSGSSNFLPESVDAIVMAQLICSTIAVALIFLIKTPAGSSVFANASP